MIRNSSTAPSFAEITPDRLIQLTAERLPAPIAALFTRGAPPEDRAMVHRMAEREIQQAALDRASARGELPPAGAAARARKADVERWPFGTDIGWSSAVAAFGGTSHVPEQRAARVIYEYADHMLKMRERLGEDFETYRAGYLPKLRAWLSAHGNTVSSMITGPANFNVRRAEKRNITADNRAADLRAFHEGFFRRRSRDAKRAARLEARQGGGIVEDLRREIADAEEQHEATKNANKELRKLSAAWAGMSPAEHQAAADRIARSVGRPALASVILNEPFVRRQGFSTANTLANIKRKRERLADEEAKAERAAAGGEDYARTVETPNGPVEVVYNREDDRLQITAKKGVIDSALLKEAALHWTPSLGIHQRQLTDRAIHAISYMLQRAGVKLDPPLPWLKQSMAARTTPADIDPDAPLTADEEAAADAEAEAELAEIGLVVPDEAEGEAEAEPEPDDYRRNGAPALRVQTGRALGPDRAFGVDFDPPGDDGYTRARMADGYGASWRVPTVSVRRWYEDLNAHLVDVPRGLDRRVDEVLDGRARFAGKGNDGLVWITPSGWAVKADTVVLYQPQNDGQRTPEQAARHLEHEADVHRALADLPMVPRLDVVRTPGGRVLLIKPALDTAPALDRADLLAVEAAVKAIHERGWIIGDRVQVGRAPDGQLYIYDLGSARRGDSAYERDGDRDYLRRLWQDAGFTRPPDADDSARLSGFYTRMVLSRLAKGERPSDSTLRAWREYTTAHGANLSDSDFDAYMLHADQMEAIEDRLRALPAG